MNARTRVKVCGLTNRADALAAIAAGADALGFNLFRGSKRFIELSANADWIEALPPFVTRVAVLVNAPLAEMRRVVAHPGIDMVQLHGDEDANYLREVARTGRPWIQVVRGCGGETAKMAGALGSRHVLIDACAPGAYGGTGQLADLEAAAALARTRADLHIILAGGLNPENVAESIARVRPYAVDVASGVEARPGEKDHAKLLSFCRAAH